MKKLNLFLFSSSLLLGLTSLTGCSSNPVISILTPGEFPALMAAKDGFVEALKAGGYEEGKNISFNYQNANGASSDMNTLAKSMTNKSILMLGIATPAAKALNAAQKENGTSIPLLFTAVTDPVQAGLTTSWTQPGGNVTGTSDTNPVAEQILLIKRCLPDVARPKIGIIYTASEINSEVQADLAEINAVLNGMDVVRQTCTDSSDIKAVATSLCQSSNVDALYIPTDNNIADNMPIIKSVTDENHTLCVVGEEGMLASGGHITYSVDYKTLGKWTGEMAVSILNGDKKPGEIDVKSMTELEDLSKSYSSKNIADSGISIPESVLADFNDVSNA